MLYLHFFQFEGDKLFQALGAKNLVEGRGITFQHVLASDLSTLVTEHVNRWPVAYSLLLAPFYRITDNLQTACVVVDILSICFFFVSFFRLLQCLQLPQYLVNALILFAGATFGPYLSKPTDLLACAGLVYACLLFIYFESGRMRSPVYGLAAGAAIIIPAAFRYMYVPCALIVPALLLWTGYKRKDSRIMSGGVYAFVAVVVLYAALAGLQKVAVGNSTYVMGAEKGFYPENLLSFYPFIPDAFIDINFTLQQVESLTSISFIFLYAFLRYINLILLIILAYGWITYLSVRRRSSTSFNSFLVFTGATGGCLLLLLSYLSLTNSSAPTSLRVPFPWTFVGDGRYFLFPVTILPAAAVYLLFMKQQWRTLHKFQQPLKFAFFVLIVFQLAHTLYFIAKRFEPLGLTAGNVLITKPGASYLRNRIDEYKKQGYNVVLTGTDETVSNWATLNGSNGLLHVEELLSSGTKPKTSTIVFVAVAKNVVPFIGHQLEEKQFKMEKEISPMLIFSRKYDIP